MLDIRNLTKSFPTPQGDVSVLRGVDLSLAGGESAALMGESGSGKSTLLHIAAGLEPADGGSVTLDGADLTRLRDAERAAIRRDKIGLVFQQFNLIPSLKVGDNLAFHARLAGREDAAWQCALTERLGLSDLLERYPEQLSGGQQQRVAFGRALAARPRLVLADEPTGNLDQETGDEVIALAFDLIAETGCAFLMATHSARLAERLGHVLRLDAGRLA